MAITLLRDGFDDLVVLEKGPTVGGVWRENRYPGAAVDVPSDLYSYSFERRYPFAKRFGEQSQLLDYVQHCADKSASRRTCARAARCRAPWEDGGWTLSLAGGETLRADVLIPACGQLSVPEHPAIPGVGTFDGPAFHTAHWPDDLDVDRQARGGRRDRRERDPGRARHRRRGGAGRRLPAHAAVAAARRWTRTTWQERSRLVEYGGRLVNWLWFEALIPGFTWPPRSMFLVRALCAAQLRWQVRDRALREKVTPDYPLGCKRILVSSDWYPALLRDDVSLITDRSRRSRRSASARAAAGARLRRDRLRHRLPDRGPRRADGDRRRGRPSLSEDAWAEGAEAYLGISVPGFPNLFLMYGPNTNLGSGSIIYMLECQMRYIADAVRRLRDGGLAGSTCARASTARSPRRCSGG